MKQKHIKSVLCLAVGHVLSTSLPLSAQEAIRSPFVAPNDKVGPVVEQTAAATPLDSIEFTGIVELAGIVTVSLRDLSSDQNYWLKPNEESEDGLILARFDRGTARGDESIVITRGGLTRTMKMKDADIITLQEPVQRPESANTETAQPPRVEQNTTAGPAIEAASDEEVRARMQRVAEEIRRRRAMRRQLLDQNGNNSSN